MLITYGTPEGALEHLLVVHDDPTRTPEMPPRSAPASSAFATECPQKCPSLALPLAKAMNRIWRQGFLPSQPLLLFMMVMVSDEASRGGNAPENAPT